MRIGFIVNDVMTEEAGFTTTRLAQEAHQQGHDAFLLHSLPSDKRGNG